MKGRADAVARSLILHSVDAKIRPQIRGLSSAYQMWILLCSRYNVASIFENHRIMAEFESLNFVQAGSALELIRQDIVLRDRYNKVAPSLGEFFWTSAVLRKLLPYYITDAKLLMQQRNYTLDLVHRYFSEFVIDPAESGPTSQFTKMLPPSDPSCNLNYANVHQQFTPRVVNNIPFLCNTGTTSANSYQHRTNTAP